MRASVRRARVPRFLLATPGPPVPHVAPPPVAPTDASASQTCGSPRTFLAAMAGFPSAAWVPLPRARSGPCYG